MSRDVIVIGGGVIGCSIAWRLAQAGLKVTVIERGRVGCEASRAAAGMLSPQGGAESGGPFFDLCLQSRAMYRKFGEELTQASGIDIEYKDEGTLFVVVEGEDQEEQTRWAKWQFEAGLPLEYLSADEVLKIEPAVTQLVTRGIFLPQEHQVENRRVMDALEVAIKRAGVELIEGCDVTAITTGRGEVTGVLCGSERLPADLVVLAAGTWSSQLLEPLGLNIRIIPALGQMIAVRDHASLIDRVIHSSKVYVVPRRDGRILIGATVEWTGFHKAVTAGAIKYLLSAALELVPSIGQLEIVETWSGLRPDTPDHLPIIGPGGVDNLLLATGHFRNGILLAPITAGLVAELISNGSLPDQLKPFGVERFKQAEESKWTEMPGARR
ncbi:MAG: glycine oxidase ThiO [Acidobacteria bacterium]|nr:MAG: glycine oxidase ThiO [Acidobacteriota bacterium]